MIKICTIFLLVTGLLQVASRASRAQETQEGSSSASISFPRVAIERLANLTQEDNLWILVPSNVSESELHNSDFSLFKLNTGQLHDQSGAWARAVSASGESEPEPRGASTRTRGGRKLNLFKNVLGKPQVSPLYLVNGTVCRFVNSQPICTTLSTTGLFRGQNQPLLQQGGTFGGLFQGNTNQQLPNNLQQPNQRQVSPQQNPNQQFNNQQFRPAAVLDNEQQVVNLASDSNLTSRTQLARPQVQRPASFAVRRPLNLLSFGRPFASG